MNCLGRCRWSLEGCNSDAATIQQFGCSRCMPASPQQQSRACREQVQIPAVVSQSCGAVSSNVGFPADKKVGYIRIATFNKKTGDLFMQQLNDLKQAGVNAFVLDIRNNGGGYFPAGVQVCAMHVTTAAALCISEAQTLNPCQL